MAVAENCNNIIHSSISESIFMLLSDKQQQNICQYGHFSSKKRLFVLNVRLVDHSLLQVKKSLFIQMNYEEYSSLYANEIYLFSKKFERMIYECFILHIHKFSFVQVFYGNSFHHI